MCRVWWTGPDGTRVRRVVAPVSVSTAVSEIIYEHVISMIYVNVLDTAYHYNRGENETFCSSHRVLSLDEVAAVKVFYRLATTSQ